jgi:hypothetical protein
MARYREFIGCGWRLGPRDVTGLLPLPSTAIRGSHAIHLGRAQTRFSSYRRIIIMNSDTVHSTHISGLALAGLSHKQIEDMLRANIERAEKNCQSASDLCKALLGRRDLNIDRSRYWQLERAMARLVQANKDHARALAELGDFLVDGTVHDLRL